MINSKLSLNLPATPLLTEAKENEQILVDYIGSLIKVIQDMAKDIYSDFEDGTSQHIVLDAVPGVTDIEEGEIKLYESGGVFKLYTKLNGAVRYVSLT